MSASPAETALIERLLCEISDEFANYPVTADARASLKDFSSTDEESRLVCKAMSVGSWQALLCNWSHPDGTLAPSLCPSSALVSFLPFFMSYILRNVCAGNEDRIFLDCFMTRVVDDSALSPSRLAVQLSPSQMRTVERFLRFIRAFAYGEMHSKDQKPVEAYLAQFMQR